MITAIGVEAFAHREGFVLSSSAPGTAHIEFVLDSTDSEDQMYISRLDGNFLAEYINQMVGSLWCVMALIAVFALYAPYYLSW